MQRIIPKFLTYLIDTELADYWDSCSKKLGKSRWAKGSKYYQSAALMGFATILTDLVERMYKC